MFRTIRVFVPSRDADARCLTVLVIQTLICFALEFRCNISVSWRVKAVSRDEVMRRSLFSCSIWRASLVIWNELAGILGSIFADSTGFKRGRICIWPRPGSTGLRSVIVSGEVKMAHHVLTFEFHIH